jgi:hypothetical protein
MSKKLVVLLGRADWAGSCYSVCEAINAIGRVECRHISLYSHIYGYPSDIVIPICYVQNPKRAEDYLKEYTKVEELFERADLIHIWNDILPAFKGLLTIPEKKVKSYTFTGTLYRENHTAINAYLKKLDAKVVVQNPTYRYLDELESEYIPHAVNTDLLKPIPFDEREPKTMACYRPAHKSTSAQNDIAFLESILKVNYPGWKFALDKMMSWEERMKLMAQCMFFFEYMDPNMGYWGRSALEACAMGVPAFSYVSSRAIRLSEGRFGDPAIIHVDRSVLRDVIKTTLSKGLDEYEDLSRKAREWVIKYYGYPTIGKLYTKFFEKILDVGPVKRLTLQSPKPQNVFNRIPLERKPAGKIGRNDPCPCGSGKKYKKCCLLTTAN